MTSKAAPKKTRKKTRGSIGGSSKTRGSGQTGKSDPGVLQDKSGNDAAESLINMDFGDEGLNVTGNKGEKKGGVSSGDIEHVLAAIVQDKTAKESDRISAARALAQMQKANGPAASSLGDMTRAELQTEIARMRALLPT